MDVTNASGAQCSTSTAAIPCPTGQVKVTDNGQALPAAEDQGAPPSNTPGTYTLNSVGFSEDQFIQFTAGSHSVVANYQGDSGYNTSASAADAIVITQATTSTALTDAAQGGGTFALTAAVSTQSNGLAPTGTVQFFNGGTAISGTPAYTGTAANPLTGTSASLQAVLTTTFAASATVTAQYMGDTNYSASAVSNTVQITANPDFGLTATTTTNTVVAGNPAMYPLSITSAFSFNSAVTLTCSVATPSGFSGTLPTCSVTSPVTPTTQTAATSTLTASTTARSLAPPVSHRGPGPIPVPFLVPLVMLFLAWMGFAWTRRRPSMARMAGLAGVTLAAMILLLALGVASCGGGSSTTTTPPPVTGTPAGTYTITVTGTSGNLSHQAMVSLVVQ